MAVFNEIFTDEYINEYPDLIDAKIVYGLKPYSPSDVNVPEKLLY